MIIGFCGNPNAGKDTAGAYLIKKYGFERKAFADPLKKSVAALFNIPFWEIDKFKGEDNVYVTIGYKNQPTDPRHFDVEGATSLDGYVPPYHMWSPISELTMRQFLQRYGTESHRDVFWQDFWVDQALPVEGFYAGRKVTLTDVRFDNEVERIHLLKGVVIRIERPGTEISSSEHIAEQNQFLNANVTIQNDRAIEDLYEQLDNLLTTLPDWMNVE